MHTSCFNPTKLSKEKPLHNASTFGKKLQALFAENNVDYVIGAHLFNVINNVDTKMMTSVVY